MAGLSSKRSNYRLRQCTKARPLQRSLRYRARAALSDMAKNGYAKMRGRLTPVHMCIERQAASVPHNLQRYAPGKMIRLRKHRCAV